MSNINRQGNAREFHIIWRVVTLVSVNMSYCVMSDCHCRKHIYNLHEPLVNVQVVVDMCVVRLVVHSNSFVVGSVATFHATLCNLNQSLLNNSFVYFWINNAVSHSTDYFDITTTVAGTAASMSKVFSMSVLPGHYLMEVRVFRKSDVWFMASEQSHPVAVGFHNFTLTGR